MSPCGGSAGVPLLGRGSASWSPLGVRPWRRLDPCGYPGQGPIPIFRVWVWIAHGFCAIGRCSGRARKSISAPQAVILMNTTTISCRQQRPELHAAFSGEHVFGLLLEHGPRAPPQPVMRPAPFWPRGDWTTTRSTTLSWSSLSLLPTLSPTRCRPSCCTCAPPSKAPDPLKSMSATAAPRPPPTTGQPPDPPMNTVVAT